MNKLNIALLLTILAISCTRTADHETAEDEILFSPGFSASMSEVRSFLYDSGNIIHDGKGDFTVMAYRTGTSQNHFNSYERIYWFKDTGQWRFYDEASNSFHVRYWPKSYGLDFFAYMPYDLNQNCHTTLGDYSEGEGPTFSCTLPTVQKDMEAAAEFVYAYATEQTAETDNGKVNLSFVHPFAAVIFKLGNAHGNTTIHSIGFKDIYRSGTFTVTPEESVQSGISAEDWEKSGEPADASISVGRAVPEEIQIGSVIGGPYIVLPQALTGSDVKLTISFTWNGVTTNAEISPTSGSLTSWEPGIRYTYTLNLGDPKEDVIADVSVEEWKGGYDNNINVQ